MSNNLKWYIIITYNGHEDKVKEAISSMAKTLNWEDNIVDLKIVKRTEINSKTKKEREKNVYPGYVFIKANMTNDVWFKIRNTSGVTGFVGSSGKGTKPFPLSDDEAERMIKQSVDLKNNKQIVINFAIGDRVTITNEKDGSEGIVKSIDYARHTAIIETEMFGRLMPMEADFQNIKKR